MTTDTPAPKFDPKAKPGYSAPPKGNYDTVTVACKIPTGLHLDVIDRNGNERRVTVQGPALPRGFDLQAALTTPDVLPQIAGGYALTQVPKDHWEAWEKEHREWPPYKNGMVFATGDSASTRDKSTEQAELKSGFEPMDPDKPAPGVTKRDATEAA